jgi:hypothetical protein
MANIVMERKNGGAFRRLDINRIAKSFPPTAETLPLDTCLIDEGPSVRQLLMQLLAGLETLRSHVSW